MQLSVTIPFYNEENNVTRVLTELTKELNSAKIDYEILAVDNGSRDKTSELIDKFSKSNSRVKKVVVKINQGYGYGILSGLANAKGKIVGWMDGDKQISADTLVKVYKFAAEKKEGIFKVNRVNRFDGMRRNLLGQSYNILMQNIFGIKCKDINGCPKLFSKENLEKMNLTSKDWFLDSEVLIKATRLKLKIYEIPVIFEKRKTGKSNVYFHTTFEFIKNIIKFYLK